MFVFNKAHDKRLLELVRLHPYNLSYAFRLFIKEYTYFTRNQVSNRYYNHIKPNNPVFVLKSHTGDEYENIKTKKVVSTTRAEAIDIIARVARNLDDAEKVVLIKKMFEVV